MSTSDPADWLLRTSNEAHAEPGSYTVDQLLEYVKGKPVVSVELERLRWQYPHDRISKKRLDGIVIEGFPIIVEELDDGDLRTLDGFHRAYKALKRGDKTIQAVVITEADLSALEKNARKRGRS